MRRAIPLLCLFGVLSLGQDATGQDKTPKRRDIRVGIIGLDTSHVIAFTKILNDAKAPPDVARCRVGFRRRPGDRTDANTPDDRRPHGQVYERDSARLVRD